MQIYLWLSMNLGHFIEWELAIFEHALVVIINEIQLKSDIFEIFNDVNNRIVPRVDAI